MCMHIVKVWCTEFCWLFAHIWLVYKSRFHFLTVSLFSLTCRYPAVIWPWWVLEKYVPGYSSAWLWMCQVSNVIIVFQCWSTSTRDSIQMEHRCGSRCTSFFWNSLSILSGLLADTENPIFVSDYWRLTSAPRGRTEFCSEFQSWHIFPACSFNHSRLTSVNHPSWFYCSVHTRSVWLFVKDEALALGVAV